MATEKLIIEVTDSGTTRVVQRNIQSLGATGAQVQTQLKSGFQNVGASAAAAVPQVDVLKRALIAVGAYMGVRQIVEYADAYVNLQNRLGLVTRNQIELASVTGHLLDISNRTRQSMAGTGELYARLAVASKTLGLSQGQVMRATETLNEAIALSGATSVEALGGMIQLAQGIASGVLRGDELRSVLEQLPAVADMIAAHMGVTRGRLRELGEQGAISAKQVMDAFIEARTEIHDKFLKTIPTVSQAFVVLGNNVMMAIGQLNRSTGIFRNLSQAIIDLSKHLGIFAGLLVMLATSAIPQVAIGLKILSAALWANPFIWIGASLGIMVAKFIDAGVTLQDFALAFETPLMAAAQFAGTVAGIFNGIVDVVKNLAVQLPGAIGDMAISAVNEIINAINWLLQKAVEGINALNAELYKMRYALHLESSGAGPAQLSAPKLEQSKAQLTSAAEMLGRDTGETFSSTFEAYLGGMTDKVSAMFNRIREDRNKAINARGMAGAGPSETAGAAQVNPLVGVKALEDLSRELAMERELIGLVGFERQVRQELGKLKIDMERQHVDLQSKEAQNVLMLAEAQVRELETLRSKANVLREVSDRHQELANEKALIGLYGAEREVQKDLGQLRNELLTKKVDLNDRDVARALATAETDLREMENLKQKNSLYDRLLTRDKEREMHARLLGELWKDNLITEKQYAQGLREANNGLDTLSGASEGFTSAFRDIDTSISAASRTIGTNLINSLDSASGAMADFALSGFRNFNSFRTALAGILADIGKMIMQVIIKMLLLKAIEAGIGALFAGAGAATPAESGGGELGGGATTGDVLYPMAGGGDIMSGRTYLVGENGPEIFKPSASGTIIPNGGGSYPPPIVNITNVRDPDEISSALSSAKCRDAILNVIGSNKTAVKGMLT